MNLDNRIVLFLNFFGFSINKAKELSPFINVSTEPLIFIIDLIKSI